MLIVFTFCWHCIDTYRTVSAGHGAFELCLPSLGFFLTKLTLRCRLLGQAGRMAKVGALGSMSDLEQYEVSDLTGICCECIEHSLGGLALYSRR